MEVVKQKEEKDSDLSESEIKKRELEEKVEFEHGLSRLGWTGATDYGDVVRAIFTGDFKPSVRGPVEQGIVEQVAEKVNIFF